MANLRHPVDIASEELAFMRNDIALDFAADDGVIDEAEQGILIAFDAAVTRIRRARGMERGIELLMKQEGKPTRYTQGVFEDIGVKLEPLDAA